jgi:hypothetical protein
MQTIAKSYGIVPLEHCEYPPIHKGFQAKVRVKVWFSDCLSHSIIPTRLWCSDDENDYIHDDSSEYADDDSDSNAEDYYRNDYPDEELSEDEYRCRFSLKAEVDTCFVRICILLRHLL